MSASDITPRPAESGLEGHYEPSQPGATSLRDAKPLWIDGQHVTAEVYFGRKVTIFLGCKLIFGGELPEEITEPSQVNPWAAQRAIELTAPVEPAPLADWEQALMVEADEQRAAEAERETKIAAVVAKIAQFKIANEPWSIGEAPLPLGITLTQESWDEGYTAKTASEREVVAHFFRSSGEAYDDSQCFDEIADGDLLVIPSEGVIGILVKAWPTATTPEAGVFHLPSKPWSRIEEGRYKEIANLAVIIAVSAQM